MAQELEALRTYVLGEGGQHQAETTVKLRVTHNNLKTAFMEIRLDRHVGWVTGNITKTFKTDCLSTKLTDRVVGDMTIDGVKRKLQTHCGTNPGSMILQLKNRSGELVVSELGPEERKLGYFSPEDGFVLHVVDTDPLSLSAQGWLEDTSKVQKYVMSDKDYDARDDTYRKFKQMKLKEDPTWTLEKELAMRRGVEYVPPMKKPTVEDEEYQAEEASYLSVGNRCEVKSQEGSKRGWVRFVGKCDGLPKGFWVGVEYDEPVGKNDGSIKGKRYFTCLDRYGGFVRPTLVSMGDYPPFDDELSFDEEDEL